MLAAFRNANRDGSGAVSGGDAVAFFSGSGLPTEKLSEIWRAATNGEPSMQPMAFKTAMELIAVAVGGGSAGAAAPVPPQPAPSSIAAPSSMTAGLAASKFLSATKLPTSVPEGSDMTPVEYKKYRAHYGKLPGGKQNSVTLEDAVKFLSKAKLDPAHIKQLLQQITGNSSFVSKEHFSVAMHETYKAIKTKGGKTPAPSQMMVTPAPAPPAVGFGGFGGGGMLDPHATGPPAANAANAANAQTSNDFGGFGAFGGEPTTTPAANVSQTDDSNFGGFSAFETQTRPSPVPEEAPPTQSTSAVPSDTGGLGGGDFDFGSGSVSAAAPASTSTDGFGGFGDFGAPAASVPAPAPAAPASTTDDGLGGFGDFGGGASAPAATVAAPAASPAPSNTFSMDDFGGGSTTNFGASSADTFNTPSQFDGDSFGMDAPVARLNSSAQPATDFQPSVEDAAAKQKAMDEAASAERVAAAATSRADAAAAAAREMQHALAEAKSRAERAETEAAAAAHKTSEAEASLAKAERDREAASQNYADASRRKTEALARAERASSAAAEIRNRTSDRERESLAATRQLEQDAEQAEHALEKVKLHAATIEENVAKASASARARVDAARRRADEIRDSANREAAAAKAKAEQESNAVREETVVAHAEVERLKLQKEAAELEHEAKMRQLKLELEEARVELRNTKDIVSAESAVGDEPLRATKAQIEVVNSELRRLRDESSAESSRATAALVAASVELAEKENEIIEAKEARAIDAEQERAAIQETEASLAVAMQVLEAEMQAAEDDAEEARSKIETLKDQIAAAEGAAQESKQEAALDAKNRADKIKSDEKRLADAADETTRILEATEVQKEQHRAELQAMHEQAFAVEKTLAEERFAFETEANARAEELPVAKNNLAAATTALETQRAELSEITQKEIEALTHVLSEITSLNEASANEKETFDAECEQRAVELENARLELEQKKDQLEVDRRERKTNAAEMEQRERDARASLESDRVKFAEQLQISKDHAATAKLASIAKTAILDAIEQEAVVLRKTVADEQNRVDGERAALEHDLNQREALLATEQTKLASALERLRFQRPREGASARQVAALEQARIQAEEERVDAEKREREARQHVEQNLAQLQSLAVAVAKATGAAAHARVGAAAAEQLAATNAAASSRSRAAVAGTTARQKAERAAAERIAAAKAEAQRIIKARNTPRPIGKSVAGTPVSVAGPSVVAGTPQTPAFASAQLFTSTPEVAAETTSSVPSAAAMTSVAATPLPFAPTAGASTFSSEFAFEGDTRGSSVVESLFVAPSVAPAPVDGAYAPSNDAFTGFAAFDAFEPSAIATPAVSVSQPAEPKKKSPEPFATSFDSPTTVRGPSLNNEDFAAFEVGGDNGDGFGKFDDEEHEVKEHEMAEENVAEETKTEQTEIVSKNETKTERNPEDNFDDFSDDEIDAAPPADKLTGLLKKGVTISATPVGSTPVGSNVFVDFDDAPKAVPKPQTQPVESVEVLDAKNETTATPPIDTPAAPQPNETTFDEDGFANFESDEDATVMEQEDAGTSGEMSGATNNTSTPALAQTAQPEIETQDSAIHPISPDDRYQFNAMFDAYTADNPPGVAGLSGGQLVQITQSANLPQKDLSAMWQLVSVPGADTLRREDFVLFCFLLKKRVAGVALPVSIDADMRTVFFGRTGGDTKEDALARAASTAPESSVTTQQGPQASPSGASQPLVCVVERFSGIKDAGKLKNVCVSMTLLDSAGRPLEAPRTTAMGAATVKPGWLVVFESPVKFATKYDSIPNDGCLLLELKHFKDGQKKMSVKCWAVFENQSNTFAPEMTLKTSKLQKPVKTDPKSRGKAKVFMKSGAEDVVVRFQ